MSDELPVGLANSEDFTRQAIELLRSDPTDPRIERISEAIQTTPIVFMAEACRVCGDRGGLTRKPWLYDNGNPIHIDCLILSTLDRPMTEQVEVLGLALEASVSYLKAERESNRRVQVTLRARELFDSFLTPSQRRCYEAGHEVRHVGQYGRYLIGKWGTMIVAKLDRFPACIEGRIYTFPDTVDERAWIYGSVPPGHYRICARPDPESDLPVYDVWLAQLLSLRADEVGVLAQANYYPAPIHPDSEHKDQDNGRIRSHWFVHGHGRPCDAEWPHHPVGRGFLRARRGWRYQRFLIEDRGLMARMRRTHTESRDERAQKARAKAEYHLALAEKWEARALAAKTALEDGRYGHASLTGRNQEIIEDRRRGLSLQQIGEKHGLTRERVRQVVRRYDRASGTNVGDEAKPIAAALAKTKAAERNTQKWASHKCPVCQKTYKTYANRIPTACSRSCAYALRQRPKVNDEQIVKFIEMRDQGMTWYGIFKASGRVVTQPASITQAVYRYLCREKMLTPATVESLFGEIGCLARRFGYPSETGEPIKNKRQALDATKVPT